MQNLLQTQMLSTTTLVHCQSKEIAQHLNASRNDINHSAYNNKVVINYLNMRKVKNDYRDAGYSCQQDI
jgi:hypothetical protein